MKILYPWGAVTGHWSRWLFKFSIPQIRCLPTLKTLKVQCDAVCLQISYLHHVERVAPVVRQSQEKIEYYRIAAHYRFILRTMFDCFQYPRVIILEVNAASDLL